MQTKALTNANILIALDVNSDKPPQKKTLGNKKAQLQNTTVIENQALEYDLDAEINHLTYRIAART